MLGTAPHGEPPRHPRRAKLLLNYAAQHVVVRDSQSWGDDVSFVGHSYFLYRGQAKALLESALGAWLYFPNWSARLMAVRGLAVAVRRESRAIEGGAQRGSHFGHLCFVH